ncbi:MAG: prepilin-type N-terminal cleavage/methylation domain-containing protein [Phycisphaerae bacterium]|jgi:prepilin-type N-terminal cleavage/methylation domain-containing protein|nr:prepilin-type N-terminal cleavage/methylation domain-containing protein [Phycisphaerae bacterium]
MLNTGRASPLATCCRTRTSRRWGGKRCHAGFTLLELLITLVVLAVLVAAVAPLARHARAGGLRTVSLKNLVVLGEAEACYANDWNDRQWSIAPRDFGVVNGSCSAYASSITCPPQAILGKSSNGASWAYFWGSQGLCAGYGYPGNCSNADVYRPINFSGADAGFGAFRLPSLRGFQEYVGEKFYEKEWYSQLDTVTWSVAEQYFPLPDQFTHVQSIGIAYAAYCLSPAAMFHPEVLRRPSLGGFRNPNASFADSYRAPSLNQCVHPELKTRMVEHSWLVNPPSPTNPNFAGDEPWYFNHGLASRPGSLFFDGSVQEMTMKQAVADDQAMLRSTKLVDGLWSRDTPFGPNGYFGAQAYDGTRNSFHILTTDGILGRDFLKRTPGRPIQ